MIVVLFLATTTQAYHTGIGGDEDSKGNVALAGCTCHAEEPDNSVTVVLDHVPYHYESGKSYPLTLQLIGGADIGGEQTGGFSMSVSGGTLDSGIGSESDVQNWEEESGSLTHTNSGSKTEDRRWNLVWTAPDSGTGPVQFWIAGNTVNGDAIPSELDRWNRLTLTLDEGEDNEKTRTVFSGNGDIIPPAPTETHVDLHHMGAALRAHWLGLLGFFAVIIVIIFCGFFLRYGFSANYTGRSNLLKLRMKHERRGDQI
jgi:hypothetical protein|tara:strand:+ start:4283 stop:5053 length:771 start_codon:yes stop_codon:yes gene_type:complete